jgi:putative oxidoreductase
MDNVSGSAGPVMDPTGAQVMDGGGAAAVAGMDNVDRAALVASIEARVIALRHRLALVSLPLLRVALGVVFIWFGALKLTGSTPVGELVARTLPFLPAHWFVPALGIFEALLGVALLAGRYLAIVAALMVAHLTGTFLVLVTQPDVAFQNGNPLMLTMTGEFVVKNVVLIIAGLVLIGRSRAVTPE